MGLGRVLISTNEVDEVPVSDLRVGFRAGYVFEIIDTRPGRSLQPIAVHVLVLNPRQYNLSEPFTSQLTPAEDDEVVSEENGIIIREITIEGTTGYAKRKSPSFVLTGGISAGGAFLTGNEHFRELRAFFRRYSELKKDPEQAPFTKLIFHSLKDDDHFVVVPRSFETPRDAKNTRLHYDYRLTLAAIDESDRVVLSRPDPFNRPLAAIADALNDARAAIQEINAEIAEVKRRIANVQAVVLNATAVVDSAANFINGATAAIEMPFNQVVNTLESIDDASDTLADAAGNATSGLVARQARNFRKAGDAINRIAAFPEKFDDAVNFGKVTDAFSGKRRLTTSDIENNQAGATDSTALELARGSEANAGVDYGAYRSFRVEEVGATDTIDRIAERFGVSRELIILINDLRFPYISEGGGPGLVAPGDSILIPLITSESEEDSVASSDEYLSSDDALYGRDFALDLEVLRKEGKFDLKVDEAHGALDAETIGGLDNVVQGTRITVETPIGGTVYVPEVGIRRSTGIKGTLSHVLLASLNLRQAILQDPRISDIEDSRVVLDGDVLTQEVLPIVKGKRDAVTYVLPFGKATGA